jgi:CcmD family protein
VNPFSGRVFAQAQPAPQPQKPTSDDRSTTFQPVQGGNELQSGEKLLVEAYCAIWLIVFTMLYFSWRRQRRINQRIDGLEDAIAKARRDAVKAEVKPAEKAASSTGSAEKASSSASEESA